MPGRAGGTGTDSPPCRHEDQEGRRERREGGRRPRGSADSARAGSGSAGARHCVGVAGDAVRRLETIQLGLPPRRDLGGAARPGVAVRETAEVGTPERARALAVPGAAGGVVAVGERRGVRGRERCGARADAAGIRSGACLSAPRNTKTAFSKRRQ